MWAILVPTSYPKRAETIVANEVDFSVIAKQCSLFAVIPLMHLSAKNSHCPTQQIAAFNETLDWNAGRRSEFQPAGKNAAATKPA